MMMRNTLVLLVMLFSLMGWSQDALNVRKIKSLDRGSSSYSGSWVYINDLGEEYGLVGTASGTAIYSLEEGNDAELAFIQGPTSNWREITVIKDHAYITSEGAGENQGLQVLSLAGLPNTASLVAIYDSTFTRAHILQKDIFNPDEPYIYVSGADSTGGLHILDVSNPLLPVEIGLYNPNEYIHDVHVRGDRMYTFKFYASLIDVIDISDKTNPILIASIPDPGGATHSGWTTEDNNFLLVADERNGFDGRIFDIRDLEDAFEVSTFTANPNTFVHNPYVLGDFAYLAHNREGLRVYDVVDPTNPIEVGYYDTVTEENPGSGGLWSACPFVPSGKVIGGDRDLGLLVWDVEEVYASRFGGIIKDMSTLETLDSVQIAIMEKQDTFITNGFGTYKSGYAVEGEITLVYSLEGYRTTHRTISLSVNEAQYNEILLKKDNGLASTDQDNLELWPNPGSQNIHMEYSTKIGANLILVQDIAGKCVLEMNAPKEGRAIIAVSQFPSGLYLFSIVNNEGQAIIVRKVEIIHP